MKIAYYAIAAALVAGILSTGCAKKAVKTETTGQGIQAQAKSEGEGVKPALEQTGQGKAVEEKEQSTPKTETLQQGEAKKESATIVEEKTKGIGDVFFDFDRFSIRDDAKPMLENNADYLKANKDMRLLIESHCDERGTSEYNIALGQRRAESARKYLVDLGVDPSSISVISYGKEKPFCTDHDEQCWQENRRAHFVAK